MIYAVLIIQIMLLMCNAFFVDSKYENYVTSWACVHIYIYINIFKNGHYLHKCPIRNEISAHVYANYAMLMDIYTSIRITYIY